MTVIQTIIEGNEVLVTNILGELIHSAEVLETINIPDSAECVDEEYVVTFEGGKSAERVTKIRTTKKRVDYE